MEDLRVFLLTHAQGDLFPWSAQVAAAERFHRSIGQIEEAVLELGLMPARYQRNRQTISLAQQLRLLRSRVVVVGAGGLGGYVIEELARLGVGQLLVLDPDVFEEHNLNRQLLSSPATLDRSKAEVAAERVMEINPAVTVTPLKIAFQRDNAGELFAGADVVVDGLDTVPSRLELAEVCRDLVIPVVHGAIAGWYGQVATQLPGEDISHHIYGSWAEPKGVERRLGNPAFTPAVVASLQVAEVSKILLGLGTGLSRRILFINLLDMEFEEIAIPYMESVKEG